MTFVFCRLHCVEMSEDKGSGSLNQDGTGEGVMKKAKEGKCLQTFFLVEFI